jgi:hypothetical protein
MYRALIQPLESAANIHKICGMKIPMKTKIFWYLCRDVILTKDNLAKKKWQGSKKSVSFVIMTRQ